MSERTNTPKHIAALARALLALCCLVALQPAAARAQDQPVLREQIKVYGDLVTLGDLFESVGDAASAAVFRSPEIGTTGVVAAQRVAAAAQQHGVEWHNPGGVGEVVVSRPGRRIELDEVSRLIEENVSENGENWTVDFSRGTRPFHIDPRITAAVSIKHIDLQPRTGRFRAVVNVVNPPYPVMDTVFTGRAFPSVEAIVATRVIERGATIVAEDLKSVRLPRAQVANSAIEDMDTAIGMAARQRLVAGRAIRRSDLEHPKLVTRNSLVTIVYQVPGMVLKAKGRALGDAAMGQSVQIENLQSKRTVEAQVTGSGAVSVSALSATARTAAAAPAKRTARRAGRSSGGQNSYIVR